MPDWNFIKPGEPVRYYPDKKTPTILNVVEKLDGSALPYGYRLEGPTLDAGATHGGYATREEALEAYRKFARNLGT